MNKLFKLSLGLALLAAIGAGAADDPLQKSNAYTLELDGEMQPGRNFFPLSILRNDEMDLLPRLGYTFTDGGGHQCLEFRTRQGVHLSQEGVGPGAGVREPLGRPYRRRQPLDQKLRHAQKFAGPGRQTAQDAQPESA